MQRTGGLNEAGVIVGIAKLGFGEKAQFGFVEDQYVDEIEQFLPEGDCRRRVEDRGCANGPRAFEERGDGGQRDFKLADSDVAFGENGAADVLCIHQSVGAGHDDNGVVGIGKGDDGGSGVRLGRLLDEGEVYALRGEKRLCFPPE